MNDSHGYTYVLFHQHVHTGNDAHKKHITHETDLLRKYLVKHIYTLHQLLGVTNQLSDLYNKIHASIQKVLFQKTLKSILRRVLKVVNVKLVGSPAKRGVMASYFSEAIYLSCCSVP